MDIDFQSELFRSLSEAVKKNADYNPTDYIDDDGLLRCARCSKRKEKILVFGTENDRRSMKVSCICECRQKELDDDESRIQSNNRMAEIARIRNLSLMDTKFRNVTFDALEETKYNAKSLKTCKKYADEFESMKSLNQGLLLWGDVGTGKSFAAASIANQLMENGTPVVMTSFVELLKSFNGNKETESDIINRVCSPDLVILDDLGAERNTDYALEKVYNVVDNIYRKNKPMIVTTNLQLSDMLNDTDIRYRRIYDRILEVCYPVRFSGPSFRKAKAGERFKEIGKLLGEEG